MGEGHIRAARLQGDPGLLRAIEAVLDHIEDAVEYVSSIRAALAASPAGPELHKRKIDLSTSILVLNVGGYVGRSTAGEIEYARLHGKKIEFLESPSTDQARLAWGDMP